MGAYLGERLGQRLSNHVNVGDIRGRGLVWAVSVAFCKGKIGSTNAS